ncbi:Cap-specific mRNA (nucleoside-2prime-O-)-methyltransferase [Diplonema papillatum]|nr:Cap-specific mRNA (nucleoside-2prime-O-)-methyltransferase [Diplonema papillatum]
MSGVAKPKNASLLWASLPGVGEPRKKRAAAADRPPKRARKSALNAYLAEDGDDDASSLTPPPPPAAAAAAAAAEPTTPPPSAEAVLPARNAEKSAGNAPFLPLKGGFDPARDRPLLTALDERFPTFNEKKQKAAAGVPAPPQQPGAPRGWPERCSLLWAVKAVLAASRGADSPFEGQIVYGGGYPGLVPSLLAELFPACSVVGVHPKPYEGILPPNLQQRLARLSPHEARKIREAAPEAAVVLVADVVEEGAEGLKGHARDAHAASELLRQREWVRALQPVVASVKFWLPSSGQRMFSFLKGEVSLPSWGPKELTEMRLLHVPAEHGCAEVEYDTLRFHRQIQFFTNMARPRKYMLYHPSNPEAPVTFMDTDVPGIDWRYNISSELSVLLGYLATKGVPPAGREAAEAAGKLSADISRNLGGDLAQFLVKKSESRKMHLDPLNEADRYLASIVDG